MNTRRKIVPVDSLFQRVQQAVVVIGTFDPLLAAHASRLGDLRLDGHPLVVLVADHPDPVLPLQARLELVAGLRTVDLVAACADGDETALPAKVIHDDRALHAHWSAAFIEHVRHRHEQS